MVTYKKPTDVTYTDMCIYIDENIYKEEYDEQKIFEYLYHLSKMLAKNSSFFRYPEYYEDFALYCASQCFMRLIDKRQFEIDENGKPKLEKIKSILNYLKSVLYPKKVDFEQFYYSQTITRTDYEDIPDPNSNYFFSYHLTDSIDRISMAEFNMCLNDSVKTAKAYLKNIPHKKNSSEFENIYISCLLTFLDSVTLKKKDIKRINELKTGVNGIPELLEKLYKEEGYNDPKLFHLDNSFSNYIKTLTTEIKHAIAKDLSVTTHDHINSNSGIKILLLSEICNEYKEED